MVAKALAQSRVSATPGIFSNLIFLSSTIKAHTQAAEDAKIARSAVAQANQGLEKQLVELVEAEKKLEANECGATAEKLEPIMKSKMVSALV